MRKFAVRGLALVAALLLTAPTLAGAVYTPAAGTPQRKAILDGLRAGNELKFRYLVDTLRVFDGKAGSVAYLIAAPQMGEIDGGTYILTRPSKAKAWKLVWADTGGGANSCAAGAVHYRWAMNLFRRFGVAPEKMIPGITEQVRTFEETAKTEPDMMCTGDLGGGPEQ